MDSQTDVKNWKIQLEQRCNNLRFSQRFIDKLLEKLDMYSKMEVIWPALQSFVDKGKYHHYPDEKWTFYKLMLIFDLFGLLDILYATSKYILNFVDELYSPHHYTSLRTSDQEKNNQGDNPQSIAKKLIDSIYLDTQLLYNLQIVIGLHLDIKQLSLTSSHLYVIQLNEKKTEDSDEIFQKYNIISAQIKLMHTSIMVLNLCRSNFNEDVNNDENKFLKFYQESQESFKKSFSYLKLMLEYEYILKERSLPENSDFYKFQASDFLNSDIITQNQTDRLKGIILQLCKIDNLGIVDIVSKCNKNQIIQKDEVDLFKFKAFQHFFTTYTLTEKQFKKQNPLNYILKLKLFQKQRFQKQFHKLSNLLQRPIRLNQNNQNNTRIISSFYQHLQANINRIFLQIDLKISGFICQSWNEKQRYAHTNVNNRIIILGKTGIGKSSLINFLIGRVQAQIAKKQKATTFFPQFFQTSLFKPQIIEDSVSGQNLQVGSEICNLPGLYDNRSMIHELCNSYFLNNVIENARKVKFVYMDLNSLWDADNLKKFIKLLALLFKVNSEYLSSLLIIYSKISDVQLQKKLISHKFQRSQNEIQQIRIYLQFLQVDKMDIQNFYNQFLQKAKVNYQFYTINSHYQTHQPQKNEQEDEQKDEQEDEQEISQEQRKKNKQKKRKKLAKTIQKNRKSIIESIQKISYVQNVTFNPYHLLSSQVKAKLDQIYNKILKQTKFYIRNNAPNFDRFIQLYNFVDKFKHIDKKNILQVYIEQKKLLNQQKKSIQLNYKNLNTKKQEQQSIMQILMSHITIFFQPWEKSLHYEINRIQTNHYENEDVEIIQNQIKSKLDEVFKISKDKSGDPTLISFDSNNLNLSQNSGQTFNNLFQTYKNRIIKLNSNRRQFLAYLKLLAVVAYDQYTIMDNSYQIKQKEKSLQSSLLKEQFKKVFILENNCKFFQLIKKIKSNAIDRIFVNIIINFRGNNINAQLRMMIEYYLELLSRNNYERNCILQDKQQAMKLKSSDKLKVDKTWRLNYYGECFCFQNVKLSQILSVNANKEKQVFYFFIPQDIKIYCNTIDLDLSEVFLNFNKSQSFNIIAKNIKISSNTCNIYISEQNIKEMTIRILSSQNNQNLKKINLYPQKKESVQTITRQILVSRTKIHHGQFLQKYQIIPNYVFIGQNLQNLKKKIILKKNFTIQNLIQFGELHLKKRRMLLSFKFQLRSQDFLHQKVQQERRVIQYIIKQFNSTSIRMKYQLFTTVFCDKIAQIINIYSKKQKKDQNIEQLQKECYLMMKDHLYTHIYKYLIEIWLKDSKFGRHYESQLVEKSKDNIKKYCQNLLSMPLIQFSRQFSSQHNLLSLTNKFIIQFQTSTMFSHQQEVSVFKNMAGFLRVIKNRVSRIFKQVSEIVQQIQDGQFIKNQISYYRQRRNNLQKRHQNDSRQTFVHTDQKWSKGTKKQALKQTQQQIQEGIRNGCLDSLKQDLRNNMKLFKFNYILREYQESHGKYHVFFDKMDEIHSQIAQAYIKTLKHTKVENELSMIPSTDEEDDKSGILFNIIKLKYKRQEQRLQKQKKIQKQKIISIATQIYFRERVSNLQSYSSDSFARRESRDSLQYNIISFDSAKYNNNIVNIIMASQIQKYTHRPIMHMFDTIICKNSSTLIGSALATPKLAESKLQYSNVYYPKFSASRLISYDPLSDEYLSIKNPQTTFTIRDLPNNLVIVAEDAKSNQRITSKYNFGQVKKQFKFRQLSQFTMHAVSLKGEQQFTNPLLDAYNDIHLPVLLSKNGYKISILSLGSGAKLQQQRRNQNFKFFNNQDFKRWQIIIDQDTNLEKLSVNDYIEHTRIWIQEKWMKNTKEMRDLFDRLEDRPFSFSSI